MGTSGDNCAAGQTPALEFRSPRAEDGLRVWELVAACPPLDRNSLYCNLLQCTHFADTSVLVEMDGEAVGWISGYRPPGNGDVLFVWQVAVDSRARGLGLARRMIFSLLGRPSLADVRYIRTTVTPGNKPSRALFRSVADKLETRMEEGAGFDEEQHFQGRHESERLITIGPFAAGQLTAERSGDQGFRRERRPVGSMKHERT